MLPPNKSTLKVWPLPVALRRISRIKGTPAVEIGWVDAPNAESAIKKAIDQYKITDPEQLYPQEEWGR
jgi:hypothetical protein